MEKGKKGQASLTISVILLAIILIIIIAAIIIIFMNPGFFNFQQQTQQTPTVIIKTIQTTPAQPTCMYPLRQIGNTCCVDNYLNNICDSDEVKKQSEPSCSRPYMRDGSSCCLDEDYNHVCDMYEYHYTRYYNTRYDYGCDSRYSRCDSDYYDSRYYDYRNDRRNCVYYPKTNTSEEYYRCY